MRHLRLNNETRLLWLDQVCINQTDVAERDAQVLLMKDVNESAQSTVTWLGEAITTTEAALDLVDEYLAANPASPYDSIYKYKTHGVEHMESECRQRKSFSDTVTDFLASERLWLEPLLLLTKASKRAPLEDHGLVQTCQWVRASWNNDLYKDAWDGTKDVLQRRWWGRCWVFQEAIASGNLWLACGRHEMLWDDFVLLSHAVFFAKIGFESDASSHSAVQDPRPWLPFSLIATSRRSGKSHKLVSNMIVTRDSKASDP
jgi:hypothetical protein